MSIKLETSQTSFKQNLGKTALALFLTLGLSACSTTSDMLDAANPVNWFEDDEAAPGASDEYPNLGTVPDRPVEPEVKREYEELRSGLVADTQQAQYSDEVLRSQAVPDANLSLIDAKKLADPAPPVEPPVANSTVSVVNTPAPSVPVVANNTLSASPAPAAEPLAPSVAQLTSQQATQPPASAAGSVSPSPNVMPSQNTNAQAISAPAALIPKRIATIYFADGASSLTDMDKSVVAQVVEIYKQGGKAIFITGHSSSIANATDQVQAGMINFKMSLNRAKAVADSFLAHGIAKSRISVEARGAKNPRYVESNEAGIAGNRRAEIYIGY